LGVRSEAFSGKQGVRMKRYLMALMAYGVCVGLLGIANDLGLIGGLPAVVAAVAMLVVNCGVFALIRTGLNERFADPSLTWFQVISALSVILFITYHSDHDRALPLMVCLLVLSFGAFRFTTREFLLASGFVLAGYAAVINLLFWRKPDLVNVYLEAFTWLTMAAVLPCFAFVGGRLSELRRRLQRTNEELSQALEMIQKMATHDTLTGLPNRALFNETLGHAIAQAARHKRSLALFFLGIDTLQEHQRHAGHLHGRFGVGRPARSPRARAACWRAWAATVRRCWVEDHAAGDDLADIATEVLAAFAPMFSVDGQELALSVSVGVCTYPTAGQDAQELLSSADIAMYRAKEQGRNRFCFYSDDLNDLTEERLALEAGLRHALPRGEIEVFYQPKVNFGNGRVNGVEALIRWRHPEMGLLMPDRFVPLAEEIGAIIPIGYWTLRRVCERGRRWWEMGMPLSVAVNLSIAIPRTEARPRSLRRSSSPRACPRRRSAESPRPW
jgi:predicted signal transduction protein with EAL and GGDEF domain